MNVQSRRWLSKLFLSCLILFLIAFVITAFSPSAKGTDPCRVTLTAADEPLQTTLARLASICGYTIELHSDQPDRPITIRLSGVPFDIALSKILGQSTNHAIVWNETQKTVLVTVFSDTDPKGSTPVKLFDKIPIPLPAKGIRFEQMSPTTSR